MTLPRFTLYDGVALGLVAVLGVGNLAIAFMGDQVVHVLGAQKMAVGGVLYRDFWDLKQPGIFFFYLIAGRIGGFSETGIHFVELVYLLVFAALLLAATKRYFRSSAVAALVPVLSVGAFYAVARDWHLTQIEGLVGLPLLLTAWIAAESAGPDRRGRAILGMSGFTGGLVALFKFVYLPIVALFWLTALAVRAHGATAQRGKTLTRDVLAISLGFAIPLALVAGYFAAHGQLPVMYRTFFLYPPHIVASVPPRWDVLYGGISWFAGYFSPVLALAVLGGYRVWLGPRSVFLVNVVLWFVAGLTLVLVQRMWWQYHYLLLLPPLAILASLGIDELVGALKQRDAVWGRAVGAMLLWLSLLVVLKPLVVESLHKMRFAVSSIGPSRGAPGGGRYTRERSPELLQMVAFLGSPESRAGDIYVFGDPTLYWLAGRGQAGAIHGWSLDGYPPELWERIHRDLVAIDPPYLFVAVTQDPIIRDRSPAIAGLIDTRYQVHSTNPEGVWFERSGRDP